MIRSLVLASVLATPLATPLAAQQRDTARLDSVVVTATRTAVALPAASLATTVISGDALRARGIAYLGDALRTIPGVALVRGGSYGGVTSLFLRGGESDYVKVLIDGIPLNAAGGGIDLASVTVDGAERIEIVRGPASGLYGSDAVTGVVNIITRAGVAHPQATVEARGGSHDWREAVIGVSGGTRVSGAATAAFRSTDGIYPFNSDHRNTTYDATLHLGRGSRGDLRLDARLADVESHYPTNGQGQLVDSNQVRREERRLVGVSAGWLFGPRVAGRLELSHAETDAVSDNAPDSEGDTLGFYSRSESDAARQRIDARLEMHLHERALVTIGSEWTRQREVARGSSMSGKTPLPDTRFDASRINRALYAQLLSGGSERFSATLGARVDDNQRFGTFITSRAAAAWRAGGTTLRVAAGTAFREPAFVEHFTTDFSVGNPALEPERTTSWEAGIARSFAADALTLSATWFDQRFRDMIQFTFQDDPAAPNYINLASARASGFEIEARIAPAEPLQVSASYTLVRTRVLDAGTGDFGAFEDGKPLLRRPKHSASALLRWRLGERGALSAEVSRVGSRDDLDFSTFPAVRRVLEPYTLVDLGGELALLPGPRASWVRLTLRAENVFDEEYEPAYGFVPPGRTVFVGARVVLGQ